MESLNTDYGTQGSSIEPQPFTIDEEGFWSLGEHHPEYVDVRVRDSATASRLRCLIEDILEYSKR